MHLVTEVARLKPYQVKRLAEVMLDASLKYEYGLNWRILFTKEKNRSLGKLRKILETLEGLTDEEFDRVSDILSEEIND